MARILRKVYEYADGTEGQSAKPGWQRLRFEFLAPEKDEDGNVVVLENRSIEREAVSQAMTECSTGHGLSQKFGDEMANIKNKAAVAGFAEDSERGFVDFATQLWDEMADNIENDVWVTEREGSGQATATILLEAIEAVLEENGEEITPEVRAKLRRNITDEDYRNSAKARPDINAHVKRIAAERAVKRAEEAAAKAQKVEASDVSSLV